MPSDKPATPDGAQAPDSTHKPRHLFRQLLKFALFFGLGVFIIWIFQRSLTPDEKTQIVEALKEANWAMAALIVVFGVLSNVFRTLRWNLLLHPMGYKPRFGNTFMSVLVAYFANLAIPRLGEVLRCTFMYRYEKVPVEKSLGTVVTERVIDILCFLVLFLASFFVEYRHLHGYVSNMFAKGMESRRGMMWVLLAVVVVAVVVCVAVVMYYRRHRDSLPEGHWMKKIASVFAGFGEGIMSLKHVRQPLWFVFHTIGIWFCYWVMLYFALHSLDALSGTGGGIALIALVMGTVGNMITPGGIGLYPVIVSETLVLFGFSKVLGYTAGWISWGTQTLAIILGGVMAIILLPLMNKEKK